jgi:hypothetical protein
MARLSQSEKGFQPSFFLPFLTAFFFAKFTPRKLFQQHRHVFAPFKECPDCRTPEIDRRKRYRDLNRVHWTELLLELSSNVSGTCVPLIDFTDTPGTHIYMNGFFCHNAQNSDLKAATPRIPSSEALFVGLQE